MTAPSLFGREAELQELTAAWDLVRSSQAAVVWVVGESGAGKSTLVMDAVGQFCSQGATLWHAAGDAQEELIEFGIADQIFDRSRGLAPGSDQADRSAPSVATNILARLSAATQSAPVVLVVDDLHWCDHSSRHMLRYLLRRLGELRVLVVLTHRPMGRWPDDVRQATGHVATRTVTVTGLSVAAVRELMAARGIALTPRAGRRLHDHTGGNPQLLRALADELTPEEISAGEGPLRAPRSFTEWVSAAYAEAAPEVRAVVAAVAVLGRAVPLAQVATLTGLEQPQSAVDAAIARRLLRLIPSGEQRLVDVEHALVRSAVEQAMPFTEYARFHSRAAMLTRDPLRAMVHRLHACATVDADLAEAASTLAESQARSGATLASARLLVLAGSVLSVGPRRHEMWTRAAERLLMIGELRWAEKLLADVAAERHRAPTAHELLVSGHLALQLGLPDEARQAAERAWESGMDPRVVVGAAELLAYLGMDVGDGEAATMWATRAIEGVDTRLAQLQWGGTVLISGGALRGELQPARRILEAHRTRLAGTPSEMDLRLGLALAALWSGDFDGAREEFAVLDQLLTNGSTVLRATMRLARAELDYREGRWGDVVELTETELRLVDEGWETRTAPMTLAVGAYVFAGQGQLGRATAFVERAEGLLAVDANVPARTMVVIARARIAMAARRPQEVVELLEPLGSGPGRRIPEGVHAWRGDLAEAYVTVERLDEAEALLKPQRTDDDHHTSAGLLRALGVVRAAQGRTEEAQQHLERAVELGEEASGAFSHARAQLALGAFLRRRGQRRQAADALAVAGRIFRRLGAQPLVVSVEQELELCARHRRVGGLTPAEETVARLAVKGLTNREIATELTVSVKTVETHMGRVFTKLGVRHRVDLVRLLVQ